MSRCLLGTVVFGGVAEDAFPLLKIPLKKSKFFVFFSFSPWRRAPAGGPLRPGVAARSQPPAAGLLGGGAGGTRWGHVLPAARAVKWRGGPNRRLPAGSCCTQARRGEPAWPKKSPGGFGFNPGTALPAPPAVERRVEI